MIELNIRKSFVSTGMRNEVKGNQILLKLVLEIALIPDIGMKRFMKIYIHCK